jgi:hypothetical protein
MADNFYALSLAEMYHLPAIAGTGFNILNSESARYFLSQNRDFVYSVELTINEIMGIEKRFLNERQYNNGFIFVHGNMQSMALCHCPVQICTKKDCPDCTFTGGLSYEDNKGYRFPMRRIRMSECYFSLYNSTTLCTYEKLKGKINHMYFICFDLDSQYICDIIKAYTTDEVSYKKHTEQDSTTGHLYKGIR